MSQNPTTTRQGVPLWVIAGALIFALALLALAFTRQQQAALEADNRATEVALAQATAAAQAAALTTQAAEATRAAGTAVAQAAEATRAAGTAVAQAAGAASAAGTAAAQAAAIEATVTQQALDLKTATLSAENAAAFAAIVPVTLIAQADELATARAEAEASRIEAEALANQATAQALRAMEDSLVTQTAAAAALAETATQQADFFNYMNTLLETATLQAATAVARGDELAVTVTAAAEALVQVASDDAARRRLELANASLRSPRYSEALLLALEAEGEAATFDGPLYQALRARPEIARQFYGHSDRVWALAFSPDGRLLASGGSDTYVYLWDVQTGRRVGPVLASHADSVFALAFSPDGRTLASGGPDGSIVLWDVESGAVLWRLTDQQGWIEALAFSPDGRMLASGGDMELVLRDAQTGERIVSLLDEAQISVNIRALAFSPDGTTLAGGSRDGSITLWNAVTRTYGRTLDGHDGWVNSLSFSADGKTLASGGSDRLLILWDIRSGEPRFQPLNHRVSLTSVRYSEDGTKLVVVSDAVTVYDTRGGQPVQIAVFDRGEANLWAGTVSPDGTYAASEGADHAVILWDIRQSTDRLSRVIGDDFQADAVRALAYSPDGSRLVTANEAGEALLWDTATGALARAFVPLPNGAFAVAYSPDGARVAVGGGEATIYVYDAVSGERLTTLTGAEGWIYSLKWSPDGTRLAACGSDGLVWLWDESGELVAVIGDSAGRRTVLWALDFSPDGQYLALGENSGLITLWDVETGAPVGDPLSQQPSGVYAVAYSPDGSRLATAGGDSEVLLWDIATRSVEARLTGHSDSVFTLAFSPDGAWLASGSADGAVYLWDVRDTGSLPRGVLFALLPDWVQSLKFSPDMSALAAGLGGLDNLAPRVVLLPLGDAAWREAACAAAGRNFTLDEWRQHFGDAPYRLTCDDLPEHDSVIRERLDAALERAEAGDDEAALAIYQQVLPAVLKTNDPGLVNNTCWLGSLYGFVETVRPACERVRELAPANGNYRDTYGVALALLGNVDGAYEQIQFFVDWAQGYPNYPSSILDRRIRWLSEFATGINPINADEVEELKRE